MESRWDQNTDTRCTRLALPYRIYILNIPLYIKCTCKWIFISLTSTIQRVQSALPASVGRNKEYTAGSDWPQKSSIQCYTKVIDMFTVWRCRIVTNDIFIVKRKRKNTNTPFLGSSEESSYYLGEFSIFECEQNLFSNITGKWWTLNYNNTTNTTVKLVFELL